MRDEIVFVITTWFLSRSVVILGMQFIAPMLHISPMVGHPLPLDYVSGFVTRSGWELFTHWDGAWYRKIAVFGYDYADDGQKHSIAFFPLFPLICRGFMSFGLPFDVAGPLTNNLSFLGALFLLYNWAEERYGVQVARWATSVLAWCPFSLFGTVAYTEGLFLFCTVGTLRSFDNCQYFRAAVWGALVTATRSIGVVLIPAFLIVAWREQRPPIAYVTTFAASGGLLLFIVYCTIQFADPLAFVHVQDAWHQSSWNVWIDIIAAALGFGKCKYGTGCFTQAAAFLGIVYLLWNLRTQLPRVAVAYSFCSLAVLFVVGGVSSIGRFIYGIAPLSLVLGILLARHPRWGWIVLIVFGSVLLYFAISFSSWWHFVADTNLGILSKTVLATCNTVGELSRFSNNPSRL